MENTILLLSIPHGSKSAKGRSAEATTFSIDHHSIAVTIKHVACLHDGILFPVTTFARQQPQPISTVSPPAMATSSSSPSPEPQLSQKSSGDTLAENHDASQEKAVEAEQEKESQPEKATGKRSLPTPAAAGPPPDGGLTAWLQVAGGFSLFFNTWGILNAFGIFQTYYESGALFHESSSNISWIGSIQAYCVLMVGFLSGPIFDRGYFRSLVIVGSFLIVFGHMMLSLCHNYWEVLLTQGFCIGIGAGCLFVPCVAILPTYFSTKVGLAIGLAAAGSSTGGVIYPIVFYKLIDQVGYGWTVRVMGFLALGTLIVPIALMKMRFKPAKARALIDWSAFTDLPFMTFVIGCLIGFIGLYVEFFYISYYAQDQKILDSAMSFYIVPILNAASTFGRVLPNALSDKTGPFNLIAPGAIIVGILVACQQVATSSAAIIVLAILFGFFSGVFVALPPVCFVALTKDKTKIGTRVGMGYGMIGFGVLAGGPGGGSILGEHPPLNWTGVWTYGGVSTLVAGIIFTVLRVRRTGPKLMVKS